MTAANFDRAFTLTLKHEGGYIDHVSDPGGSTNLGITISTLANYLGRRVTKDEVRALTPQSVRPIYRKGYWDKIRAGELPAGVDYAAYDLAVNSGPSRAVSMLRRAVGIAETGTLDAPIMERLARSDPSVTINRICDDRLNFLRRLATWSTFGRGWSRRVEGVRAEALAMVTALAPRQEVVSGELPWITKARTYLGLTEVSGSSHAPQILEFWRLCELPFKDDETPWCAGFVGACLEQSGIRSTRSGLAASYLKWGVPLSEPRIGAVLVFNRSAGSGHVGFCVGEQGDKLLVLGGNQANAVNIKAFPKSQLKPGGIRWPDSVPVAAPATAPAPVPIPAPVEPPMPYPAPSPTVDPVLPPKPWYQSRVLIGALVGIVLPYAARYIPGMAGVSTDAATNMLVNAIDVLGPLIGGALVVTGRVSATRPIAGTQAAQDVIEARAARQEALAYAEQQVPPGYVPVQESWAQPQEPAQVDISRLPLALVVQQLPALIDMVQQVSHLATVRRPDTP